jgi:hypothetical protein
MPWSPEDAQRHTHKANTPERARQWSHVANSALARGESEGSAIRQANAAVGQHPAGHRHGAHKKSRFHELR